jgi:hypothetical protein
MDASFKSAGHASPGHIRGFSKNRSLRSEGRSAGKKNRALLIPRARGGFVESSCDGLRVVFISIAKAPCQAFAAIFFFAARVLLVFPAEHCKRRANSGAGFDASGEKPEKNAER